MFNLTFINSIMFQTNKNFSAQPILNINKTMHFLCWAVQQIYCINIISFATRINTTQAGQFPKYLVEQICMYTMYKMRDVAPSSSLYLSLSLSLVPFDLVRFQNIYYIYVQSS